MRNVRPLLLVAMSVFVAGCALLTRPYRPPHAPKSEAEKIKFPWGSPRETVVLSGVWLRAVTMALDDFLPEDEAVAARSEGEEAECLARRENYYTEAWVWSPGKKSSAEDGGELEADGGSGLEEDAGYDAGSGYENAFDQPGMPKAPTVIYVTIFLLPGRCELDGSPLLDMGAVYAIDTVNWQVLAIHH